MIKELRRKFILISISSVALVLLLIIGSINIASYCSIIKTADTVLNVLVNGGGVFPDMPHEDETGDENPIESAREAVIDTNSEMQFERRFFTVTFITETEIVINLDRIAAVDAETAVKYALDLLVKGSNNGFKGYYRYIKTSITTDKGQSDMYIFLDCNRELLTFYNFLFTSILVSVSGLLLVLVLLIVFSKSAIKPIAESYEKQKRFITDASHELKTPLTIISANTDVLEIEQGSNEWTESIRNQVMRLKDFTEKLVLLAKMDEEGAPLNKKDFSLSDVIKNATESFRVAAESMQKTLACDIESNVVYYGDEGMIKVLADVLIDNAVKYSNDGGTIFVGLKAGIHNCTFTVYNTAEHIDIDKLDMIFERFYRLDESRNSEKGGHGIGMSAAKAIVTAHGGKITADSDGESMTITVTL